MANKHLNLYLNSLPIHVADPSYPLSLLTSLPTRLVQTPSSTFLAHGPLCYDHIFT